MNSLATQPFTGDVIDRKPLAQIAEIIKAKELPEDKAIAVRNAFVPFFADAQALIEKSKQIIVPDATHVTEIKASGEYRGKLKKLRNAADKARRDLKDGALREGQAIQDVYNAFLAIVEPEEARLTEQEQIAERMEAARKAKLKADREEILKPYGTNTGFYALADMPAADFDKLVEKEQWAYAQVQEEKERAQRLERRRAELAKVTPDPVEGLADMTDELYEETLAHYAGLKRQAEEAARIEREKLAAENARLKAEADKARADQAKRDADAQKERAELEAANRREREAREKLERDARDAKAAAEKAEADRKAAEAAEAKRMAMAPDREKLIAWADAIDAIEPPVMGTPETTTLLVQIDHALGTLTARIRAAAEKLGGGA